MALTQCAVFYWNGNRGIALKDLKDDDSQYALNRGNQWMSFFLTPLVPNSKQKGCPDDPTCRTLIAQHTGQPVQPPQFTAALDDLGNVITSLAEIDPSLPVALIGVPGVKSLVAAPALANGEPVVMEGDTFSVGVFSRRYVIADATTGLVLSVATAPVGQAVPTLSSQVAVPSTTLQIGQVAPLPKTAIAITPTI